MRVVLKELMTTSSSPNRLLITDLPKLRIVEICVYLRNRIMIFYTQSKHRCGINSNSCNQYTQHNHDQSKGSIRSKIKWNLN